MGDYLIPFLFVLAFLAILVRDDAMLTLLYLLAGSVVAGLWWSRRALAAVRVRRSFPRRLFFGEKASFRLELENFSLLPVVWLQVNESLPIELISPNFFRQVISLGSRSKTRFEYNLEGRRRGYFPIGPLRLSSGDLLGAVEDYQRMLDPEFLTVYPKIVPLTRVRLPSHSPLGTLRHTLPIFEDPSRPVGKRDYVSGDSLRRVDWKATASSGRLQVKQFEPSIALETYIILNLNIDEYELRWRFSGVELAVVVAASLANYVVGLRQSIGLFANANDPLSEDGRAARIPPRRGRLHLMRLLDSLARIEAAPGPPLAEALQKEIVHLSWGTTLIVITNLVNDDLFSELFATRRQGLNALLIVCGAVPNWEALRHRAMAFGFPIFQFFSDKDLDIWRQ